MYETDPIAIYNIIVYELWIAGSAEVKIFYEFLLWIISLILLYLYEKKVYWISKPLCFVNKLGKIDYEV